MMQAHPFIYVGCFVGLQELTDKVKCIRANCLDKIVQNPHITFSYKPVTVSKALFGQKVDIQIVGYGNDGKNEGLKVHAFAKNPQLQKMIAQIPTPHITLSVSKDSQAKNTKYLSFSPIEPICLTGTYGGYAEWGEIIL